jgi:capsular exopolysaccharide synthesis family protein
MGALLAALAWSFSARPTFTATALLRVEREEPRVLKFEQVVRDDVQGESAQTQLQTVQRLLQGRTLANRVIALVDLENNPEFRHLRDGPRDMTRTFLDRLQVDPLRNARLVKLSFWSHDPRLSADVANTLVDEFMTQHVSQKVEATRYATVFLTTQKEEARKKLESAEAQLAQFLRDNDIRFVHVDRVSEPQALINQQLVSLSDALLKTRAERIAKESVFDHAVRGDMDSIPAVLQSPLIAHLKEEAAALGRKYRELGQSFKQDYPRMQRLAESRAEVRQQLEEATRHIVGAISTEYRVALQNELELEKLVDEQRSLARTLDGQMVRYNLLRREADTSRDLYTALSTRLKETQIAASLLTSNISVVDRAEAPRMSDRPPLMVNVLLAAMVGLIGGIALAFLRESLDPSIRDADEVEAILQVPILGLVPARSAVPARGARPLAQHGTDAEASLALLTDEGSGSLLAEAFRNVRTSVVYSVVDHPPKTMMITSLQEQDGAGGVAANCAISFAQLQAGPVLLIDANMRHSNLHEILGVQRSPGLSSLLAGCAKLGDVIGPASSCNGLGAAIEMKIPGLSVIPAGPIPANPVELLASPQFAETLATLTERFAHIVIAAPPMIGVSDAVVLAPRVEGVILVLRHGHTHRDAAQHAIRALESVRARILGVVLNHVDVKTPGWGAYTFPGPNGVRRESAAPARTSRGDE